MTAAPGSVANDAFSCKTTISSPNLSRYGRPLRMKRRSRQGLLGGGGVGVGDGFGDGGVGGVGGDGAQGYAGAGWGGEQGGVAAAAAGELGAAPGLAAVERDLHGGGGDRGGLGELQVPDREPDDLLAGRRGTVEGHVLHGIAQGQQRLDGARPAAEAGRRDRGLEGP